MRYQLHLSGEGLTSQKFIIEEESAVIGRGKDADLRVPTETISRRHARLHWDQDQLWIEDLDSSNGTFVNGRRLTARHLLAPNDEIRLGHRVVLRVQAEGVEVAPGAAQTILGTEQAQKESVSPPWISIAAEGESLRSFLLSQSKSTLGSAAENTIVLPSDFPPTYARIERRDEGVYLFLLESEPVPTLNGRPFVSGNLLRPDDEILIPRAENPPLRLLYHRTQGDTLRAREEEILFGERTTISIGRASDNDVVLDAPTVSRHHARVTRQGERIKIEDLRTSNGTFVNGRRVSSAWLEMGDTVRIGLYRFVVGGEGLAQYAETEGMWLAAVGLNQWVRPDLNILQDVSVVIEPREMVVVVGQSGSGKTTLLNAFSGFRPAGQGEVVVNGVNIYRNFDSIRQNIGYVPQQDIIHKELTVWEALDFAAQLRMPPDTSEEERHVRIQQTLEDLDLAHRSDVPISHLSGGQQKRASIGVELLTQPGLFFLDEPTSGLDPGTETGFMRMLRRFADQGRTIIIVTHTTKNIALADKVIFMARGGYLAFYGPPEEALAYFDEYRSEEERQLAPMSFDEIYTLLDDETRGEPADWGKRFRQHKAYRRYIDEPLRMKQQLPSLDETARTSLLPASESALRLPPAPRPKVPLPRTRASSVHQLRVLFARNLRVLARDRFSLALMLLVAPLVSTMDFLLAALLGRSPYDFYEGSFPVVMTTLFSLTIYAVMVGSLSLMREITKERDIYRRERLVNLKMMPYAFSKLGVAIVLAFYQAIWYVVLHYLAFDMPGGIQEMPLVYVTLALTALAGMMLGLLSSSLAPSANAAPLIVILFMVPQIVLSGAQVPLPDAISALSSTRWGLESLMSITGVGSDLMADPCWQLPSTTRALMTVEEETALCRCMGLNLMNPDVCQFPGIGQYATPMLAAPPPVAPIPLGDPPAEPELPEPPQVPETTAGPVAVALYLQDMQDYQAEVIALQDSYKAKLTEYQSRADIYAAQMFVYQQSLLRWQIGRSLALEPAKGMVAHFLDDYGWTFVNQENRPLFWRKVTMTWLGQTGIIVAVFLAMLISLRWRDR